MEKENTEKSVFKRILDFLVGNDSAGKKKRALKKLIRNMNKKGYTFYKNRSGILTPDFARLLYQIYHAVSSSRTAFDVLKTPEQLRYSVLTYALPPEIQNLLENLDAEKIRAEAETADYKTLYSRVKKDVETLKAYFTPEQRAKVGRVYEAVSVYRAFCMFDYYALLKGFCPSLKENNFSVEVKFGESFGRGYAGAVSDFASVLLPFIRSDALDVQIAFANALNNTVKIQIAQIQDIKKLLTAYDADSVFENICCILNQDPEYAVQQFIPGASEIAQILNSVVAKASAALHEIYEENKSERIDQAVKNVFTEVPNSVMQYYTEAFCSKLAVLHAGSLMYAVAVDYMAAFFDIVDIKDIRNLFVVLSVKGRVASREDMLKFSDLYDEFSEIRKRISLLDSKLSPNNQQGYVLTKMIHSRIISDDERMNMVSMIRGLNKEASGILQSSVSCMTQFAEIMHTFASDSVKDDGEIITNWLTVNHELSRPAKEILSDAATRMELMCVLLKLFSVQHAV